jgi:hypothetical protein
MNLETQTIINISILIITALGVYMYVITENNNRRRFIAEIAIRKAKDCNDIFLKFLDTGAKLQPLNTDRNNSVNTHKFWYPITNEIVTSIFILEDTKLLFRHRFIKTKSEMETIYSIFWQELAIKIRSELISAKDQDNLSLFVSEEFIGQLSKIQTKFSQQLGFY